MSLGARLILLGQQLKSKKSRQCSRCELFYHQSQENCPHCTGLSDRQVEELIENHKKIQTGNVLYLTFLFAALVFFFVVLIWVF